MFISSTILYFGENPVGYDMFKTTDGFEFKPTPNTTSNLLPPTIVVHSHNNNYQIEGVQNEDLQRQVMRLVGLHHVIGLDGRLTAAS